MKSWKLILCLLAVFATKALAEPIHRAAEAGELTEVKALLAADPALLESRDKSGDMTPIMWAASGGQLEVVRYLLSQGASVTTRPEKVPPQQRATLLHAAAAGGNKDIIALVLARGLDIDAHNDDIATPLFYAIAARKEAAAEFLIAQGADTGFRVSQTGYTLLQIAAEKGSPGVVKTLLARKVPLEVADITGMTPLMASVMNGHIEVVRLLLHAGANLETRDQQKFTALHYAAFFGELPIAKLLVQGGANLEAKDDMGRVPAVIAANEGSTAVAQYLQSLRK